MPIYRLERNQPTDRFYTGGPRIRDFRQISGSATHEPEDWLASTTTIFGERSLGLSALTDGEWLRDAIARDPIAFLGAEHVTQSGANPLLLTKLLDAGQRLPVHFHPDGTFASAHLGRSHGKHEAWYMLKTADVYVGFKEDTSFDRVLELVKCQDSAVLLSLLNRVRVSRGDTVFVPAGVPHAIGAGAFLVEVQQPTDQSILMEWHSFDIEESDCFLGLDHQTALSNLNRTGLTRSDLESLISRRSASARSAALVASATTYFRIEEHDARSSSMIDQGYQVIVILEGSATIRESDNGVSVKRGDTLLVTHSIQGKWENRSNDFEAISCRPPAV